jgi:hypothetical protein
VAQLDLRLMPERNLERSLGLIRYHIEERERNLIGDQEPTNVERWAYPCIISFTSNRYYGAFRTPVSDYLTRAMVADFGSAPMRIRIPGYSVPITMFINESILPTVIAPAANANKNQQSPD